MPGKKSNAHSLDIAKRTGERSRLYVFAVTAVTVFLVSLIVRRPRPVGFEVEAALRHEVTGSPESWKILAEDPSNEIRSYLCGQVDTAGDHGACDSLSVTTRKREEDPSARLIIVRYRDSSLSAAKSALDQATQQFAEAHNRPDRRSDIEADRAGCTTNIQFWQARLESIQRELDQYVQQEFDRQRAQFENRHSADPGPPARPDRQPARMPVVERSTNPRWEALNRQYQEADAQLQGLLARYTDAHPLVIEARRATSAYLAELERTPRDAGAGVESTKNGESGEARTFIVNETIHVPATSTPANFDGQKAKREILSSSIATKLQESLRDASNKRREAVLQLKAVPSPDSTFSESAFIEMPAAKVATLRAPIDGSFLWNMIALSVFVGIALSIPRDHVNTPTTLFSTEDVQQSLEIPIRGELTTGDGPLVKRPAASTVPAATRRIVTTCEFAIAVTAVLLLACVFVSPGFVSEAVQDPINAVGSTLERLGIYR